MKITYTKKQKVPDVKIDDHDVWNMCNTLAFIILPMLKKLKNEKRGAPVVENEDVPTELHSPEGVDIYVEPDADPNFFKRWDYVLDEMIWAFEQYTIDDDKQFYHNIDNREITFKPLENNPEFDEIVFGVKDENKPAPWFDKDGFIKHEERKTGGLRLFAKYYNSLWD